MAAKRAAKKGAKERWKDAAAGRVPLDEAVRRWNAAVNAGGTKYDAIIDVNEGYSVPMSYDTLQRLRRAGKLPGALKPLPSGRGRQT